MDRLWGDMLGRRDKGAEGVNEWRAYLQGLTASRTLAATVVPQEVAQSLLQPTGGTKTKVARRAVACWRVRR